MTLLLQYTLLYAAVLILVGLGGMISERSGVINLGLEGIMVIGALAGALTLRACPEPTAWVMLLVVAVSAAAGVLYSLLLAVAANTFQADQTLVGTGMNMLATAAATVLVKAMNTAADPTNVSSTVSFGPASESLFIRIGNWSISWFSVIALIALLIVGFTIKRTRFGLRLVSCGEHPHAADSVGVNVNKMRYTGVMLSGILGGIGGIAYITAGVNEWQFEYGVAGFGYLALAVMIFGQWKALPIAGAALLFGILRSLTNVYTGIPFFESLGLPSMVYSILPYLISLIVLALTSKHSRAPKAEGIPYVKGELS